MPINAVLAGIAVADFDSGLAWYERLLGRPADRIPMDGLAEWQITETGWIQVIGDADHAGTAMLTLGVDNLEEHVAVLAERDLAAGARTASQLFRTATITDPEGNKITFAEALSTDD